MAPAHLRAPQATELFCPLAEPAPGAPGSEGSHKETSPEGETKVTSKKQPQPLKLDDSRAISFLRQVGKEKCLLHPILQRIVEATFHNPGQAKHGQRWYGCEQRDF